MNKLVVKLKITDFSDPRVLSIVGALGVSAQSEKSEKTTFKEAFEEAKNKAKAAPESAPEEPKAKPATKAKTPPKAPVVEEEPEDEEPEISLKEIRALLSTKVADHREAIKDKLNFYDAANVTTLEEEHYRAFYKYLESL